MKTSTDIIMAVAGLMSSVTVPVYPGNKPLRSDNDEFVVVNSFQVGADVMQKAIVNINYYVKDIEPGIPNTVTIQAGEAVILGLFEKVTGTNYLIDFEGSEVITDEDDYHFSNLRFSYKNINNV